MTVWQPYCPKCKEDLQGNNSVVLPYICSCGTWVYSWMKQEFEVVPTAPLPRQ